MSTHFYPRAQAALDRGTHTAYDLIGIVPSFFSEISTDDAVTQINRHYAHGGGWHDFKGFELRDGENPKLLYPGDPPMLAIASWQLRDEKIILFDHAWVAVIQPNGDYRVARID